MGKELTKKQKRDVLETLAANIRSETGTDLSACCGEDEETVEAVQKYMRRVAAALETSHLWRRR